MLNLGNGSNMLQISSKVICIENQHFCALDFVASFVLNVDVVCWKDLNSILTFLMILPKVRDEIILEACTPVCFS